MMKTKIWLLAGTVLLITLLVSPVASAGEDRGWYVGAGAGSSDDDALSESDTGLKAFGGFRFTKIVAVEVAYVDLGDFLAGFLSQSGVAFEGEATLPIGDKFGVLRRQVSLPGKWTFHRIATMARTARSDSVERSTLASTGPSARSGSASTTSGEEMSICCRGARFTGSSRSFSGM